MPRLDPDVKAAIEAEVAKAIANPSAYFAVPDTYHLGYAHAVERVRGAASVLITHMRTRIEDCHCGGWAELGKSHAQHVVDALADYLTGLAEGNTTDGQP